MIINKAMEVEKEKGKKSKKGQLQRMTGAAPEEGARRHIAHSPN